jgi:hypothetical protein
VPRERRLIGRDSYPSALADSTSVWGRDWAERKTREMTDKEGGS